MCDRLATKIRLYLLVLGVLLLAVQALKAEELRLGGPGGWSDWTLPGDAVGVADGVLKPAFVRQNIDAVQNAATFGGGIRAAGTALNRAPLLIDGNVETTWAPAAEAPLEDWWIEVDLGRVVSARTIRLHFAEDSEPLEFFKVFTSDGEPFFTSAGVAIEGTLRYNKRRLYSFNQDRVIEIDFGLKPLQHIRIQADKKTLGTQLSELSVESVGDNLSLGARERGGQIDVHSLVGSGRDERHENPLISRNLIDGDITSYWGRKEGRGVTPVGLFILDLGVLFWVDRVRLLGDFTGLPTTGERARTRFGSINYLWYKMSGSDGSLAPDGSLRWISLGELPESLRNRRDIVHFEERFPPTKLRYVRLLFGMTSGALSGTTAEFQVFGEGFPAALTALSPIFDLGGEKTISALDWRALVPPNTRLEIRSRTGNLLDEEYSFYDKNGKEVSARKYDKLIPSFRGRIDTVRTIGSDWSNWSPVYEVSGQGFLSPGPRQFAQIEVQLLSEDPFSAPALETLTLHFHPPLVQQTQAEIYPAEVDPGAPQNFTYFLRSTATSANRGFDQILLSSSAAVRFRALRINGEEASVQIEERDDGPLLVLDRAVRRSGLLEIDFESTLYLNQTRFDALLFNSSLEGQMQQVDAGDASEAVASETVSVALPAASDLLDNLTISTQLLTPNGDGIGDRLALEFNLLKVLDPRTVRVAIFDLTGRQVHLLSEAEQVAGRVALEWDGRDHTGDLVAPGNYVLYVEASGDARTDQVSRIISVAY
ncbi:MAG: hypothetical protein OXI58_01720 [Gemmatimonadota bacterium]|nr:hypothetical protein [Gemmatimonadota bacterium]